MPSEQQSLINAKVSLQALIRVPNDRLETLIWRMTEKPLSPQQKELAINVLDAYTGGGFETLSQAIICITGQ